MLASSSAAMRVLLLLATFFCAASAANIVVRQTTSTSNLASTNVSCSAYSQIANYSTVGSNSSYRAAFLRSTSDGTAKAASMLNQAEVQLPTLMFDRQLNAQCGNATATAIREAANNFTSGVVLGFAIQAAPGVSPSGPEGFITLGTVIACLFVMCGTWSAL